MILDRVIASEGLDGNWRTYREWRFESLDQATYHALLSGLDLTTDGQGNWFTMVQDPFFFKYRWDAVNFLRQGARGRSGDNTTVPATINNERFKAGEW